MSEVEHDHQSLGAYALGGLNPDDTNAVEAHLATCADCRSELAELVELRTTLGSVPPEAFLEGTPDDDLLLQRTLRQLRGTQQEHSQPSRFGVAAAAVVIALVALGGGVLLGRQTAPGGDTHTPQSGLAQPPPGSRNAQATNPVTGASMTLTLTPRPGWVRVHAVINGVSAGQPCQLFVVSRDGNTVLAGSWLVSDKGALEGTTLDGSALIDPGKVSSVDVVTAEGRELISVNI